MRTRLLFRSIVLVALFCSLVEQVKAQWQIVNSGGTQRIINFCQVDSATIVALGDSGAIYRSTDSGITWQVDTNLIGGLKYICEGGQDTLYAGGKELFRSNDAGLTWFHVATFTDTISKVMFFNSKNGFAIVPLYFSCSSSAGTVMNPHFKVVSTSDFGVSWQTLFTSIGNETYTAFDLVKFEDSVACVIAGSNQIQYHCSGMHFNKSMVTNTAGSSWSTFLNWNLRLSECYQMNDSILLAEESYNYFSWIKINKNSLQITPVTLNFNGIGSRKDMVFMNEIDGYLVSADSVYTTSSVGLGWNFDYKAPVRLNSLFKSLNGFILCGGNNATILRKQHIPNLLPDTVWNISTSQGNLNFGCVSVSDSSIKSIHLNSNSSVPVIVEVTCNNGLSVLDSNGVYNSVAFFALNPGNSISVKLKFSNSASGIYSDSILFVVQGKDTVSVKTTGICYSLTPGPLSFLMGTIDSDTLLCADTIIVVGTITIEPNTVVEICAGTKVLIADEFGIFVEGVLKTLGTEIDRVRFIPMLSSRRWGGIQINNISSTDTSIIEYSDFTGGMINNGAIFLKSGNLSLFNSNIHNYDQVFTGLTGIKAGQYNTSTNLEILKCNIECNGVLGVSLYKVNKALIENCDIHGALTGIKNQLSYKTEIVNNSIYDNSLGVYSEDSLILVKNKIFGNGTGFIFKGVQLKMAANSLYCNTLYGGAKLSIYGGDILLNQNLIFNNTNKYENTAGVFIEQKSPSVASNLFCINNTISNNNAMALTEGIDFNVLNNSLISGKFINNIIFNAEFPLLSANIGLSNFDVSYNFIHQNNIQTWNSTNIYGNPGFINESDSTGVISTPDSVDWKLSLNSICVNVGSPFDTSLLEDLDFAGSPRISDLTVDLGAYELQMSSIDSNLIQGDFILFPNPSSGYIEIKDGLNNSNGYRIISMAGQVVKNESYFNTPRIFVGDLERGCYFLEMNIDGIGLKYIRFIKF